jgi:hypothetical protein
LHRILHDGTALLRTTSSGLSLSRSVITATMRLRDRLIETNRQRPI